MSAFLSCPKGCDDRRPPTWDLTTGKWVCECCGYTGTAREFGVEPARRAGTHSEVVQGEKTAGSAIPLLWEI